MLWLFLVKLYQALFTKVKEQFYLIYTIGFAELLNPFNACYKIYRQHVYTHSLWRLRCKPFSKPS